MKPQHSLVEHITLRYRPISNTWYCLKENEAGVPVTSACKIHLRIQVQVKCRYKYKYKYKYTYKYK